MEELLKKTVKYWLQTGIGGESEVISLTIFLYGPRVKVSPCDDDVGVRPPHGLPQLLDLAHPGLLLLVARLARLELGPLRKQSQEETGTMQ